jgi:hypothetical protein
VFWASDTRKGGTLHWQHMHMRRAFLEVTDTNWISSERRHLLVSARSSLHCSFSPEPPNTLILPPFFQTLLIAGIFFGLAILPITLRCHPVGRPNAYSLARSRNVYLPLATHPRRRSAPLWLSSRPEEQRGSLVLSGMCM